MNELEPLIEEYRQLEAAVNALAGVSPAGGTRRSSTIKARVGRPRGATSGAKTVRKRGRPRGSGTRAAEALALVKSKPGITIPEMAAAMGIKQNYLYRVLPGLAESKKVRKRGRGWHAVA